MQSRERLAILRIDPSGRPASVLVLLTCLGESSVRIDNASASKTAGEFTDRSATLVVRSRSNGINFGVVKHTIPHNSTTLRVSRFGATTTINTIGGVRNRS